MNHFENPPAQVPVLASSSPTFLQVIPSVWSLSEQIWYRLRFSCPQLHAGRLSGLLLAEKISVRWKEVWLGQWQFHVVHGIGCGQTSTHSWKSVSITLYGWNYYKLVCAHWCNFERILRIEYGFVADKPVYIVATPMQNLENDELTRYKTKFSLRESLKILPS